MARLRHLFSDWRFYIVVAYFVLALMTVSLYRSVQESRTSDRELIQDNATRHLSNCREVEGVKTGIRLFLHQIESLNRRLDGEEAEARARIYEQFISDYFSEVSCPRQP